QMIFDHVAHGASRVVETAPSLDAEVLGHRDLHAFHVGSIPDRLEQRVGETKEQHVVDRPLAEIVIDAEDGRLVERAHESSVELLCRPQIAAERFLDDHSPAGRTTGPRELIDYRSKQYRWNREVMGRVYRGAELGADRVKGCRLSVITVDVTQK